MATTDCPHKLSNQTREGGHRNAYTILMESKPSMAHMGDTVCTTAQVVHHPKLYGRVTEVLRSHLEFTTTYVGESKVSWNQVLYFEETKKLHLAIREDDIFGKNLKHQISTSVVTAGDLEEHASFFSVKQIIINR